MRLFDSSSIFVSPGSSLIHSCAMAWRDPNLTWEDMGRVGEGGDASGGIFANIFACLHLYVVVGAVHCSVLKREQTDISIIGAAHGTRHKRLQNWRVHGACVVRKLLPERGHELLEGRGISPHGRPVGAGRAEGEVEEDTQLIGAIGAATVQHLRRICMRRIGI